MVKKKKKKENNKNPCLLSMCKWFTFAFMSLVDICNVLFFFFPLQNSMFSKGCIQAHVPSATNILTSRTTSFCGLRQAAFSALWLSPLLQAQNNNACHC